MKLKIKDQVLLRIVCSQSKINGPVFSSLSMINSPVRNTTKCKQWNKLGKFLGFSERFIYSERGSLLLVLESFVFSDNLSYIDIDLHDRTH